MPHGKLRFDTDVLILGAGAAGLAAATGLSAAGVSATVLEARDRIGGRVLTRHDVHSGMHVELGAEFVHGDSRTAREWLAFSRTTVIDLVRTGRSLTNGRLSSNDLTFDELARRLGRLRRPRHDLPFAEFIARLPARALSARARSLALTLVEGFDAADASRISTHSVLDEWAGTAAVSAPTFRPRDGYAAMLEAIRARLDPGSIDLRLNCAVREVNWQRGRVEVLAHGQGGDVRFTARRAIVTLPLSILKLAPDAPGAVRFTPALTRKRTALEALAFGPVIKVAMSFREPFWESIDGGEHRDVTFLRAPAAPFPTFWTTLPVRSPVLTAWAAGPRAVHLGTLDETRILERALASVDTLFRRRIRSARLLQAAWVQDWQRDPYARGAYSYVVAGGNGAQRKLATPLDDALYFAGEATDPEEGATVIGALHSGQRAARSILRRAS